MTVTNYRLGGDARVAIGWQVDKDTLATTAIQLHHASVAIKKNQENFVPVGGHGTKFAHKHGMRELYKGPTVMLTALASKQAASILLESAMRGTPTATQASGDLVVTNDGGSYINTLVLNGMRPLAAGVGNLDITNRRLYINVVDGGGGTGHTVNVYKDSGRTQLVATGTGDDLGAVTLAESNSSGLSGTVTLGTVSGDDLDIIVTYTKITYQIATLPTKYFTLWHDTGQEVYHAKSCVVKKLTVSYPGKDAVYLIAELLSMDYSDAGTWPSTVGTLDYDYYLAADSAVALEKVAGGSYTLTLLTYAVIIDGENLAAPLTLAAQPEVFLEQMAPVFKVELTADFGDEMKELQNQAEDLTLKDISATLTYSSWILRIIQRNMEWEDADPAELTMGAVDGSTPSTHGEFGATGRALEDITGGEEPAAVTLEYSP